MIDALFGSKTRVKLLHLFLNHPGQPFYVREITRKIEEQINSVRRELSNMLEVGIITSDSADNKLYYQVNQRYEYYVPLRAIFADAKDDVKIIQPVEVATNKVYESELAGITGLRVAIAAGVLVKGSVSPVDLILAGNVSMTKVKAVIRMIEKQEGRDVNYSVLPYEEFYYRLSIRDKFITEILDSNHSVVIDKDNVLTKE
ncbi:MAG TPA: transcriptional regulator [Candidatus Saccharibacteria bacterium]|nr:transcriptional regulator [Candidatus Saccharibacteria bacterium]HRQ06972.1 transcriptional regulator [Candidatus Saccharibacteria bacterium]